MATLTEEKAIALAKGIVADLQEEGLDNNEIDVVLQFAMQEWPYQTKYRDVEVE